MLGGFPRVLLTGARGRLGGWLRPRLARNNPLRSTDILELGEPLSGEEIIQADISDFAQTERLVAGTRAIIHLGGVSVEDTFANILPANIVGVYNLFEAARQAGVKRVIYASTHHVVGFYGRDQHLTPTTLPRPDTLYGVSKAYGEALGSYYVSKYGMEVACIRIGSAEPKPRDIRDLSTWLSLPDLLRLIEACLAAPEFGFEILYGVSGNDRAWWSNAPSGPIRYEPLDNAERFAAEHLGESCWDPRDPTDPAVHFQGGKFAATGLVSPSAKASAE
jgi:uronate dehydrogenase